MDATTFSSLALACAPQVHPITVQALVAVESSFNPHAIGVVGGALDRQPRNLTEALATAAQLKASGKNFSVGLAQINFRNFERLGLNTATAFDPCEILRAMQSVLTECFDRSSAKSPPQVALRQALSCYYSGNSITGFRHGYVYRVVNAVSQKRKASSVSP